MREPRRVAGCVMALAIGACSRNEQAASPPPAPPTAQARPGPALASRAEADTPDRPSPVDLGPLDAVAADLTGSEPIIAVAGYRDEDGVAAIPIYAQRNGGWRRIGTVAWPESEGANVVAVDAGDLDGDGRPELAALGRIADEGGGSRAELAVYRLDGGDLALVADVRLDGAASELWLGDEDGDGRPEIAVRGRRLARLYSLDEGRLVSRSRRAPAAPRDHDRVIMPLPGPAGRMRVVVRAASGCPSVLGTIRQWNAELARLRPR
jgi:hypothetical protein